MRFHKALTVLVLIIALSLSPVPGPSNAAERLSSARVIAVNDGDTVTIMMDGKTYRARLIGIDAPEMGQAPWGERARKHLKMLLKNVKWRVSVETDIERYDKYNRLLVYLWTPDGELMNERMIRDGYSLLFTIQPNSKHVNRLRKAQRSARGEKVGIWGPDGLSETPLDYKKKNPRR